MIATTTVLISYCKGTRDILDVCLANLRKHTFRPDLCVRVIFDKEQTFDADDIVRLYGVEAFGYEFHKPDEITGSFIHGNMLDAAMADVITEYLLTLDSDCFPVANGWFDEMFNFVRDGAGCAGIVHPWAPIPEGYQKGEIERRIRDNHCYRNTHVACQLTKTSFIVDNCISFADGDDTGFTVFNMARKKGLHVYGIMPTRCPLPNSEFSSFDPEMNRHVCVVFGDRIYHHAGGSRNHRGENLHLQDAFSAARERVLKEKGAEWLLDDQNSYKYQFDKEEAVADFKMKMMYNRMVDYLRTHQTLFKS